MSTQKYYKRYASGGRFKNEQLDDGLRAMQIQSQNITSQLENQRNQANRVADQFIKESDRVAKIEEQNRKLNRQISVELPEKMRANALKRNNDINQKSAKDQIAEYRRLEAVWSRLTPSLAKTFGDAAGNIEKFIQTENAVERLSDLNASGQLEGVSQFYHATLKEADLLEFSQQRYKLYTDALKNGESVDKLQYNYLTDKLKTRNPVFKDQFTLQMKENFDGFETHFLNHLQEMGIPVNEKNVARLYEIRAYELLEQYNISPVSKNGIEITNLIRKQGLAKEQQFRLGREYESETQVINGFSKGIKALSSEKIIRADFQTDKQFTDAKETNYDRRNALFVDSITSTNARPVQNPDGSYADPLVPNTRANIVGWAKSEMDNYNNLQTYLEHVFGVTSEHPDGYVIPGGTKNGKKERIFSKFPYLKQEITDDFAERFEKKEDVQKTITKARHQSEALQYKDKMDAGYYKENPEAFWEDWEATNGNSYARELFAGSLGFKSQYIDESTLTSTIVQQYKNGNMREVYHAWAALPDEQQKIGFIYNDLNALAKYHGVEFQDLDDHIKKLTNATIEEVEKDGVIDKSAGPSASTMSEYMRSELLARYARDQNGTPAERYARAKESIDKQLGYSNGVLVNFDQDGYRGSGLFKQKQGKSGASNKVIFTRFAGENFGNISSFEIDATLGSTRGQSRVNGLVDLVAADMASNKPTINNTHLYNLLTTGTTTNPLLNQLMKKSTLNGVLKEDFLNTLKNTVDADARTKKAVMQWGADKWCDHQLGPVANGLTNDQKALQVCVDVIEQQFDMPAWKFLLNAKNRELLQN